MFLNKVVLVDHIVCGIGSKSCRSDRCLAILYRQSGSYIVLSLPEMNLKYSIFTALDLVTHVNIWFQNFYA